MNEDEKIVKPGRVDGHNSKHKSGRVTIPPKLRYELSIIFREHIANGAVKDKKVGQQTIEKRKDVILGFFSDLYRLKYKIKLVKNLSQRHIEAVFKFLEEQGQSPATLQNKLSIIRIFCEWIGKPGMVKASHYYVESPESIQRTMVVQEDKSWVAKDIEVLEKVAEIEKDDVMAAGVLLLCYGFALRIREAVLMNVFKAEDHGSLNVVYGTKGGRPRSVPIEHEWQWSLLKKATGMTDQKTGRFIRRGDDTEASIQHVYHVMRKHKLTLAKLGVTAHGLRHQYMHERFYELLGIEPPVRGGDLSEVDKKDFDSATEKLMERAGHSRKPIGAHYYGSRRRRVPSASKEDTSKEDTGEE